MKKLSLVAAAILAALALPASAQTPPTGYKLQEMNFDMWCQETMHYPPERCDKRSPKDNEAFQNYRTLIEKYEMQKLQKQRADEERTETIMHNDSLEQPAGPAPTQPGSEGTIPEPH